MNVTFVVNSKKSMRDLYISGVTHKTSQYNLRIVSQDPEICRLSRTYFDSPVKEFKDFNRFTKRIANFFALIRLWKHKDRTRSHFIRAISLYGTRRQRRLLGRPRNIGLEDSAPSLLALLVRVFSIHPLFSFVRIAFDALVFLESLRFVDNDYKGTVIIPYSGELDGKYDLQVALYKRTRAIVVSFQSGWDNLSSKNFIYSKPDIFGVWGEQSLNHLRSIQSNYVSKSIILGNPRRVVVGPSLIEKKQQKQNLIFASDGHGLDDVFMLRLLVNFASPELDILYRPHPFSRNPISMKTLHDLFGDKIQIINEIGPEDNLRFLSALRNTKLLICQLSTLCVEALMLRVPVCIPLFSESDYKFGYKEAFEQLHHYIGLQLIPELFPVYESRDLKPAIDSILMKPLHFSSNMEWICSNVNFTDEMLALLHKINFEML